MKLERERNTEFIGLEGIDYDLDVEKPAVTFSRVLSFQNFTSAAFAEQGLLIKNPQKHPFQIPGARVRIVR